MALKVDSAPAEERYRQALFVDPMSFGMGFFVS